MTCKVFGTAVVVALLTIGCGQGQQSQPDPAPASSAHAQAGESEARIEIATTAVQLFEGYAENEVAADSLFRGAPLRVTGTVQAVQVDVMDKPVVLLDGDGFSHVQANGLTRDAAGTLRKGASITLVCVGGGSTLGSPMLDECAIEAG